MDVKKTIETDYINEKPFKVEPWLKEKSTKYKYSVDHLYKCLRQSPHFKSRFYNRTEINAAIKEIITACIIGDGMLKKPTKHCPTSHLVLTTQHEEYAKYLSQLFNTNGLYARVVLHSNAGTFEIAGHTATRTQGYRVVTQTNQFFNRMREECYTTNGRRLPEDLQITPTMLLHYFLQEGYTSHNQSTKLIELGLCTNRYPKNDVEKFADKLNRFSPHIHSPHHNEQYVLRIYNQTSITDFLKYIGQCPVSCFKYKFKYPRYNQPPKPASTKNPKEMTK